MIRVNVSPYHKKIRHLIWLVLTVSILLCHSMCNVAGNPHSLITKQAYAMVTSPSVILKEGNYSGVSTICANNTSANVNVTAPLFDYVDNSNSNVDSSPEEGTHSNFTAQQYGPDLLYDTLTEESTVMNVNDTENFVDNNVSDVDGSPDKGTHSNFTAQQYEDSFFDTLTEEKTNTNFLVKKGTFTKATTTGTQAITGIGFEPKTVIFWWTRQTSFGELAAIHVGYGFATHYGAAYQNFGVASASDDNAASSNTGRRRSETYSIIILSSGTPTMTAQASVTAFNGDGFDLNWQANEVRADIIHYVALGGTDLTDARAGSLSLTASTGTQDVTNVEFQPDFAMFLWTFTQAVDTGTANAEIGLGFAVSSTERAAIVANSEDARPTMDTWRQQRTDSCILLLTPTSGAQDAIVDFSQFLTNGFRLNKIDAPASATPIFYLALKGGDYNIGSFNSPTSTGNQDVTGVGFQPNLVMLLTQGRSASTAIGAHAELALGAATSSSERGMTWFEDTDALADSDNEQETSQTRVIQWRDRTAINTFTLRGSADFVSFLSDGFRVSWSNVETAGRQIVYVAFGGKSYELDLETQWTTADPIQTYEYLCIKTGTLNEENLRVDVWNGTDWITLTSALTASAWNNFSISSYLSSATLTIRFKGATETNDTAQSTWQIACSLLHTWSQQTNNKLDLEIQWTDVSYTRTNKELCIKTGDGTWGAEDIKIDVWNGSTWITVISDLQPNAWNNISVASYSTSATFTIRYKDGTETGDTNQDSWNIDAALLHAWTESTYDYVLQVVNQATDNWTINLQVYDASNIAPRLLKTTISFHDGNSSDQIIVNNGIIAQAEGQPYSLAGNTTIYISMRNLQANATGTSYLYAYLKIRVPDKSTYSLYIITFEIT